MPEVSVNVEVYCARCGDGLCNQTEATTTYNRREPSFRVDPCEKCLEVAKDEGDSEGYERGRAEAEAEMESEVNDA